MKVNEFLASVRSGLEEETARTKSAAPDAYMAMVNTFPIKSRQEFLDWLGDGSDIPHDTFPAILRRVAGHNEVHDRLGISPAYAQELLQRWQDNHAHE